MPLPVFIFLGIALVIGGVIAMILSLRSLTVDQVSRRLVEYTAEESVATKKRWEAAQVRQDELSGSFSTRTMLPVFRSLGGLFGRLTPAKSLDELRRQLAIAGNPLGLGAREFYGLRLVFSLLGFWVAYIQLRGGVTRNSVIISVLALVVCTYLPKRWLVGRVRGRQNKIRKGLPDALDMLSVCAEAGLGFDQSLQRIYEQWKTPIGIEFGRVVAEMEMGVSRRDALRHMAERLEVQELSSFVAVILQSDELGMSIADTLHAQAKQMREERRFRAQEQARKVPLKMLFPMLLLILPAMFAVVLGPTVPILVELFNNLMGNP
jgi:tight adherence protein C